MATPNTTNAADRLEINPEKTITPGPGEIAYGTYHEVIEWELRVSIERYFDFLCAAKNQ